MGSLLRPVIMFLLGNLENKYFQSVAYVFFPMIFLVARYALKVFADRYSQGGRRDKNKMTGFQVKEFYMAMQGQDGHGWL